MTHAMMTLASDRATYDIVGDVHGQAETLFALLRSCGWQIDGFDPAGTSPIRAHHPEGRFVIFTGDLVNKGPDSLCVLRLLMGLLQNGNGASVIGNHDAALLAGLRDPAAATRNIRRTLRAIQAKGPIFAQKVIGMLLSLPAQIRIPMPPDHPMRGDGWLTVVHAACPATHLDRDTPKAISRNIFGFTPARETRRARGRKHWAQRYDGVRWIVHGHTPARGLACVGRTICLDTGAGEGHSLTLLQLDRAEIRALPVPLARPAAIAA